MEGLIDHYVVLGLPSGEEGFKISDKEITKAYRLKALELHPDKRSDDPNAVIEFQRLQSSYEILKDENSRKAFDANLAIRIQQQKVFEQHYYCNERIETEVSEEEERKYRRMMSKVKQRKIKKILLDHEERDCRRMIAAMKERKRNVIRYDFDDRTRARLMNNLVG